MPNNLLFSASATELDGTDIEWRYYDEGVAHQLSEGEPPFEFEWEARDGVVYWRNELWSDSSKWITDRQVVQDAYQQWIARMVVEEA